MNRRGAKDAKRVFYFLAPLAPWRFVILLSSGGFDPFVVVYGTGSAEELVHPHWGSSRFRNHVER